MSTVSASESLKRFMTTMRHRGMTDASVRLSQNLHGCLGYSSCLHSIFGNSPHVTDLNRNYFCFFARVTLDCLAEAFCAFFALAVPCPTFTHTRLTAMFLDVCAQKHLHGNWAGIAAQMHELDTHLPPLGDTREPNALHVGVMPEPTTLLGVLTRIDQYTLDLLHFLEENIEQSAFNKSK